MAAVFRSASDFADIRSKEEPVSFRFAANDFADSLQRRKLITAGVKNRVKFLANVHGLLNVELPACRAQNPADPYKAVALAVADLHLQVHLHTLHIALLPTNLNIPRSIGRIISLILT